MKRKLSALIIITLLASCTTQDSIVLNKPILPIFSLTRSSTYQQQLDAYKESLDLMIIYSNNLDRQIRRDYRVEYNLLSHKEYKQEENNNGKGK